VRVAVIDSGVNPAHPHIHGVEGGITIHAEGVEEGYLDALGHGTAVMAAIQEKAPDAKYFAVRVFQSALRTRIECLLRALEWSIEQSMDLINLSLGSTNATHAGRFMPLISQAAANGAILVSAREANGAAALPGSLPGVYGVSLDWNLPRQTFSYRKNGGDLEWLASGYPRTAPGIRPERNLNGVSFAVANMTGFIACACESLKDRSLDTVRAALTAEADRMSAYHD